MKKTAFTLAEVLITLAIIGVVAAVSIPSVISNSNQQQYRTGLKKAISVLNSAITMNMALEGETPYDNANLMGYLMRHMSVMKSTTDITKYFVALAPQNNTQFNNATFYTTDGMRFEFRWGGLTINNFPLYENPTVYACHSNVLTIGSNRCGGCGSYGLPNNVDGTTKPPCMIMVDVNGDRKPNPDNVNCKSASCAKPYKISDPKGLRLTDLFSIMITDKQAVPYGVAAQRAMYQAQKKSN